MIRSKKKTACKRCKKTFKILHKKGSTRVKYCYACRPIVIKEKMNILQKKYAEIKQQKKGYIIPDEDQLIFYGYKEPLSKFAGGFGYKGVLSYNKEKDKVQCHLCGRLFRNVGSHSAFFHKLSASEYKIKTGLEQQTALVGEGTRNLLIAAHKEIPSFSQRGKSKKQIKAHMKKMSDKGSRKSKKQWTLERRNKHGNCPEQLVERIKKLQEKLGRRPTAKEYAKEYGSFQSITTVYGKWEDALKIAKIPLFSDEKAMRSDPDFLIEHMKQFYEKYGRSPRTSDMRRGLLPYHQIYCKVFGTLNNARQAAGIPVILMNGKYKWEEVMLKK